jgi:hypothetical protein
VGRLFVVAAMLAGCRATGTFTCELDEQCRHGGFTGRCELPSMYCSFPDTMCASGSRYDGNAPSTHAGKCVGEELVDAGLDSGMFDVLKCPASYSITLPSTSLTSRYRVVQASFTWKQQDVGCKADHASATHLALPQTPQEIIELAQALGSQPSTLFYVGVVQNPAATMVGDGWILLDDTTLDAAGWEAGDPHDVDDVEDRMEQYAMLNRTPQRLNDDTGTGTRAAVCECDGTSMGSLVTQYIAGNP